MAGLVGVPAVDAVAEMLPIPYVLIGSTGMESDDKGETTDLSA